MTATDGSAIEAGVAVEVVEEDGSGWVSAAIIEAVGGVTKGKFNESEGDGLRSGCGEGTGGCEGEEAEAMEGDAAII